MDRAWLTVRAMLVDAFIASQPYDAQGAFTLLHAIGGESACRELHIAHAASRRHLIAILDADERQLEGARASMVRVAEALDRLRGIEA